MLVEAVLELELVAILDEDVVVEIVEGDEFELFKVDEDDELDDDVVCEAWVALVLTVDCEPLVEVEFVVVPPPASSIELVGSPGCVSCTLLANPLAKNTPAMATTTISEAIKTVKIIRSLFSQSLFFL